MSRTVPHAPQTMLLQAPEWHAYVQAGRTASINANRLSILEAAGLFLDLTGQPASSELAAAGRALLEARDFSLWRDKLLSGQAVNNTEERAAWHTMLRAPAP